MPSFSQVCRLPSGCFTAARVVHVAGAAAYHLLAHPPVQVCMLHQPTSIVSAGLTLAENTHICSQMDWLSSKQPPLLAYSTGRFATPPDCPDNNINIANWEKHASIASHFYSASNLHHLLLPRAGTGTIS